MKHCKYHIVFAPKFRRKAFYGWKRIDIVEPEVCPDHVHILSGILWKFAVFTFVGLLKGKSGLPIYEEHPGLKFKYSNRIPVQRPLCRHGR